jgi:hypothetical protein
LSFDFIAIEMGTKMPEFKIDAVLVEGPLEVMRPVSY